MCCHTCVMELHCHFPHFLLCLFLRSSSPACMHTPTYSIFGYPVLAGFYPLYLMRVVTIPCTLQWLVMCTIILCYELHCHFPHFSLCQFIKEFFSSVHAHTYVFYFWLSSTCRTLSTVFMRVVTIPCTLQWLVICAINFSV